MCQISCLYQKVHNLPEISSYAAGLRYLRALVTDHKVSQSKIAKNLTDKNKKHSLLLFWPFPMYLLLKQCRGKLQMQRFNSAFL